MTNENLVDLFPQYVTSSIRNDPEDILFKKIEFSILTDRCFKEKKRELMALLYQWKAGQQIIKLNSSAEQQERMRRVRTINGITEDEFYVYGSAVPLISYTYKGKQHSFPKVMDIFHKYDIEVKSFKVLKSDVILNVWCEGNHLNVNPEDNTFCYEPSCVPFSKECIEQLMRLMSTINLDSCYVRRELYRSVIQEVMPLVHQQEENNEN